MNLMSLLAMGRIRLCDASIFMAVAATAFGGCSKANDAAGNPRQNGISAEAAENVAMPPAIMASHTYRCGDNSVLTADFFTDGTTMLLRGASGSTRRRLTAAAKGLPFIGENETVTVRGLSLTIEEKDRPTRLCKRD